MTDAPQVLPQHHLRKLRLLTFNNDSDKLAQQCAAENREFAGKLGGLVQFVEWVQNRWAISASVATVATQRPPRSSCERTLRQQWPELHKFGSSRI